MAHLRLIRGRVPDKSDDTPRRRAADCLTEERFRFPADEVWEVSCRSDDDREQSDPTPESRAS